jgi:hypothetical protein
MSREQKKRKGMFGEEDRRRMFFWLDVMHAGI